MALLRLMHQMPLSLTKLDILESSFFFLLYEVYPFPVSHSSRSSLTVLAGFCSKRGQVREFADLHLLDQESGGCRSPCHLLWDPESNASSRRWGAPAARAPAMLPGRVCGEARPQGGVAPQCIRHVDSSWPLQRLQCSTEARKSQTRRTPAPS